MHYELEQSHDYCRHYGSGKTEFAANYANWLNENGKRPIVADLDIVNPYFRARELKEVFGIKEYESSQAIMRMIIISMYPLLQLHCGLVLNLRINSALSMLAVIRPEPMYWQDIPDCFQTENTIWGSW